MWPARSTTSSRQPGTLTTSPSCLLGGSPTSEHSGCLCPEQVSHFTKTAWRPLCNLYKLFAVAALHLSIPAASAQSRSATSPNQHEDPCATSISCLQWQPYIWAFKVRLLRAGQLLHPDNPKTLTLSQSCLPVAALHLSNLAASDQLRDGCKGMRVHPLRDDGPEICMWDVMPYDEFKETRTRARPLPAEACPWWQSWNF